MKIEEYSINSLRLLSQTDNIPYDLLLLADETKPAINKYIHHSYIFVYERESLPIATMVLKENNRTEIEIKNIAVATDFQGRGLGSWLIQQAYHIALRKGYSWLIVGTGDHSYRQINFYEKLGFIKYGIIKNFFTDHYPKPIFENKKILRDMIMLKKTLTA